MHWHTNNGHDVITFSYTIPSSNVASFPGLPHLQLLIASSMQKAGGVEGLGTRLVLMCMGYWLIAHVIQISSKLHILFTAYITWTKAGATGMAGTAMAVPVFEEEKWHCWDSDLRVRSYIQSFLLEASAGAKATTIREDCSMLSWVLVSNRANFHSLGTRPTHMEWRQD